MSAELPIKASSDYVSNRLEQLERRLEQAKEARDSYIETLKQQNAVNEQQQASNQPRNQIPISQSMPIPQRPSLMRRLETGQYFWNFQNQSEAHSFTPLQTSDPVPRGMVLNSDLTSMTKRLREIGSSIRNLRDYRLSMPSDDYFKSVRPHLQHAGNYSSYYGDPQKADLPSLAEIRSRILNMQFNVEKRAREILDHKLSQQLATLTASQPNLSNFESVKPPEWLKQQELEEELKKISVTHLKETNKVVNEKVEVQHKPIEPPSQFIVQKEPEIKVEEKPVVISSNRQILFGSNQPKQHEVEAPKQEASTGHYNRMLDILRPKQVDVSSSDDSEAALAAPSSSGQQQQQTTSTQQEAKPLPTFLQTTSSIFSTPSTTTTQKPTLTQLVKPPSLDDSDSDFFK